MTFVFLFFPVLTLSECPSWLWSMSHPQQMTLLLCVLSRILQKTCFPCQAFMFCTSLLPPDQCCLVNMYCATHSWCCLENMSYCHHPVPLPLALAQYCPYPLHLHCISLSYYQPEHIDNSEYLKTLDTIIKVYEEFTRHFGCGDPRNQGACSQHKGKCSRCGTNA